MRGALRTPGVRWVLPMHAADLALEYASSVALMVLVYDATNSPLAAALMLVAKQVVPGALLGFAGRILEPVDPRAGLMVAYGARAASFALLAVASAGVALYVIAFAAGLAGVASRIFIRATVARVTTGQAFREVTAIQNVIFGVMALIGPALGALGASTIDGGGAMLIWAALAACMLAGAATMPAVLRLQPAARDDDVASELEPAASNDGAAAHGRGALARIPAWSMLALGGLLACMFSMDEPALLAYVQDALGGGVGLYGTILVIWGAGVIVGGLIYSRIGVRSPLRAIVGGVACTAIGYVGLGLAPTIAVAAAAAVLGGTGNGMYWVALVTAVLERAPDGQEARISGRLEGLATAMPALGIVLGGAVAEWVDPRVTLWVPGLLALVALAIWLVPVLAPRRPRVSAPPIFSHPPRLPEPEERLVPLLRATGDSALAPDPDRPALSRSTSMPVRF